MRFKNLLYFIVLSLCIVTSCQNEDKNSKRIIRTEKPVTAVDVSIDTTNSYNNMFLNAPVIDSYLVKNDLGDTLSNRIRSFYNSRNNEYAWFSSEGIPEHTVSFWNMLKNYLNYSKDSSVYGKELDKKFEALMQEDSVIVKNDSLYQKMELDLTRYLYIYADHAYAEDPNFDIKSLEWYVPKKKLTLQGTLDSVLAKKGQFSEAYAPVNSQYKKLREKLEVYKQIKDNGGWPVVHTQVEIMKKGYKSPAVIELKQRLKAEGFLNAPDSLLTPVYDSSLMDAVNAAKRVYGYKEDGTAGKTFIKDLNATIDERIQQILINMERMRWIPIETNDTGRAILVNIPEYKMHVYEGGKPAWDMDVVVGKVGNHTTIFTGKLNQVVFSPYWNVPTSIIKKEILPKGSGYMARNHMEYYNNGSGASKIRQKPGPWNSLGLVKFLFPNSYDIYFHDSPAKSLFNKDKRSFSHGCIRLKEPAKFAEYILDDPDKWSAEKVDSAMNSYEEKYIRVKNPVPVLITYFTSWVDGDTDSIHFREDIYGYDEIVAKKMFLNSLETTRSTKTDKDSANNKKRSSIAKKDTTGK